MQQWIDEKIEESQTTIAAKTAELEQLRQQLAAADEDGATATLDGKIADAEDASWPPKPMAPVGATSSPSPTSTTICPHDPFHTLVFITVLLLVGTVVKDLFLVANNVLVARLAQLATFDLRKLFYRRTLRMDLATFSEDGTADLMSRFTNDMNQVADGLGLAVRQADPRAAEDVRLPGAGGVHLAGGCCC